MQLKMGTVVKLLRINHGPRQTLGNLLIYDNVYDLFKCKTLELPWKNNEPRISCIPVGKYNVIRHKSPKFGDCFWIKNVLLRSEILIHRGNFYTDILGCVLVGQAFTDIDGDGLLDVTYSQKTVNHLLSILPGMFDIEILGNK